MKQFKTSFLLHDDSLEILNEVSDEEAGKLLKAIAKAHKAILSEKTEWVNSDNLGLNRLEWVLFKPFYNQLLRDYEAYQITVEVNRENGKKGGRPRKEEPKKPNGLKNNPNNPDTIRYDTIREDSDTIREGKDTKHKGKEQDLPLWLDRQAWGEWVQFRAEKKQKLTPLSIKKQLNFLEKNQHCHVEILEQSIKNGWTGLFEIKNKPSSNGMFSSTVEKGLNGVQEFING